MRRSRIRWITYAVVAVPLLVTACGRTDKAPGADSAPRANALVGAGRAASSYPGALTKPIDAYSGDELYELTRNLTYAGSHERDRKCRNSAGCEGAKTTRVQVSAVATQDSLSAADVPPFGVVYVRAINRGDAEEARYGLRPGSSLRYYMIVHRDSSGALRWRLEELETANPRRHAQVGTGAFQGCGHETRWTAGARADFKTCEAAERADSVVTLGLALQVTGDPIWSACGNGCCIF